jgi:hypothetical protein
MTGFNSAFTAESVAYLPKFQSQYGTGWKAHDAVENTIGDLVMMVQNNKWDQLFLRGLATQVIPQ